MRGQGKGFLLVTVALVVAGLLTLTAVGLSRSATDLLMTNRFVAGHQAFSMAEAGVDAAIYEFTRGADAFVTNSDWTRDPNPSHTNQGTPPCRKDLDPSCRRAIATATGIVTVQVDDFAGLQPRITATGVSASMPSVSRRLIIQGSVAPEPFGDFGLFAGKVIGLARGGMTATVFVSSDSYDSQLGDYDQLFGDGTRNKGYEGHVGVNVSGVAMGKSSGASVQLDGRVYKSSSAIANFTNATCNQGGGSHACGAADISTIPTKSLPPIEVPAALTAMASGGGCAGPLTVPAGTTTTLLSSVGDYCYQSINVNGGTLVLEPNVRVYLTGDGTSYYSNGAPKYIFGLYAYYADPWAVPVEAKMIANGNNQIYGGQGHFLVSSTLGLETTTQKPRDLIIRLRGTPESTGIPLKFQQAQSFYGAIYLETGLASFAGYHPSTGGSSAGQIYGAIVSGRNLTVNDFDATAPTYQVHRDVALRDLSLSGATRGPFKVRSWRQHE